MNILPFCIIGIAKCTKITHLLRFRCILFPFMLVISKYFITFVTQIINYNGRQAQEDKPNKGTL